MQASEQVEKHLSANMNISKKDIVIGNFLGGLAWGLGSVIGAGVVFTAIGFLLNSLGVFSTIGIIFSSLGNVNQQIQSLPQIPNLK